MIHVVKFITDNSCPPSFSIYRHFDLREDHAWLHLILKNMQLKRIENNFISPKQRLCDKERKQVKDKIIHCLTFKSTLYRKHKRLKLTWQHNSSKQVKNVSILGGMILDEKKQTLGQNCDFSVSNVSKLKRFSSLNMENSLLKCQRCILRLLFGGGGVGKNIWKRLTVCYCIIL